MVGWVWPMEACPPWTARKSHVGTCVSQVMNGVLCRRVAGTQVEQRGPVGPSVVLTQHVLCSLSHRATVEGRSKKLSTFGG